MLCSTRSHARSGEHIEERLYDFEAMHDAVGDMRITGKLLDIVSGFESLAERVNRFVSANKVSLLLLIQ